jgi:hypothetical protein
MDYFQTKIPIWVNFGGPRNGIFLAIWYFYPVLVFCTQKKSGNPGTNPTIFGFTATTPAL